MALTFDGSTNTISGLVINSANITDGTIVNADINASAAIASTKLSGVTSGITMARQWRITSNYDISTSAGNTDLTSNWESVDTTGAGAIGSNLTNSSGIFTFPSTGIYRIDATSEMYSQWPDSASTDNWRVIYRIKTTTDNSSYSTVAITSSFIEAPASKYSSVYLSYIFDVTNTSTHKFKLSQEVESATVTFAGDSNVTRTGFFVMRLGDT